MFLPSKHLLSAFKKTLPSKNPSKNLAFTKNPYKAPSKNPSKNHILLENLLRALLRSVRLHDPLGVHPNYGSAFPTSEIPEKEPWSARKFPERCPGLAFSFPRTAREPKGPPPSVRTKIMPASTLCPGEAWSPKIRDFPMLGRKCSTFRLLEEWLGDFPRKKSTLRLLEERPRVPNSEISLGNVALWLLEES